MKRDSSIDLYAPWREPEIAEALHVGRERELDAIVGAVNAFIAGGAPLPMYVFGPRGVGKSHLITVARARIASAVAASDAVISWVPEDIPAQRSAEGLLARMESGVLMRGWTRWGRDDDGDIAVAGKRIVLLEGLDRQLHALGSSGRHQLRRLLDERQDLWIVGTGVSLSQTFTGREEAFYGAFDLRPLEPLGEDEALALLDAIAEASSELRGWSSRRNTLVALAGGNARALVALALACRRHPDGWASQQLHDVLRDFTAHYQLRFRDLSPQHQQMVALFAESPRELTPSDLARELDTSASQMSVQAGRLVDDGVLRQRVSSDEGRDKRQTWYSLAEPLFRHWLEYRNASWDQTRARWLGRLLEALMSPTELADAWWAHPDEDIRHAAGGVLGGDHARDAWRKLYVAATPPDAALVARAADLEPTSLTLAFIMRIVEADAGALLDKAFGKRVSKAGLPDQHALLEFDADVRDKRQAPRAAFISYIERIAACFDGDAPRPFGPLHLHRVACVAILDRHRRGGPWKLDERERATLARIPVLRAYFAEHGRLASHRPMIEPDDVLAQLQGDAFDAGALMIVGVVQHHAELTRRAADLFHAGSDWHLAPSPLPAESLPRDVADAVLAAALRAGAPPALMTWGASLANASDATFDATLAALPRERGDFGEHAELALTALRLRDAERFDRARDESSAAWAPIFAQAALLADQLAQAEHGQLHPELEMLRRALA